MHYEDVEIVALLLRLKKARGKDVFSTGELAPMLGISQQSVSRRLKDAELKGIIRRELCKGGQRIGVPDKGMALVRSALSELTEATGGEMRKNQKFGGFVVSGSGEGAYYLSLEKYFSQLREKLGFEPFKGTLNIEIRDDANLSAKGEFVSRLPIIIEGFFESGRSFGEIMCFKCRIKNIECAVIVPKRTHHEERIVEVVAPVKLRDELGLDEGDEVEVEPY